MLIGALVVIAFLILNYYTLYRPKQRNSLNMENQDVFKYFGTDDGLNIMWYHRAITKDRLLVALNDDAVHMIEADVIFGKVNPQDVDQEPVMGHDKDDKIDLTVYQFVDMVIAHKKRKGIKLDFKDIFAVKPALKYLQSKKDEINFPVWLNGDTVLGPGGTVPQVDGERFVQLANKYFPIATLSLGFAYHAPSHTPLTQNMVKDMYDLAKKSNQPVTFAINVAMFTASIAPISWLIHQEPKRFSITLWTSLAAKNWEGADPRSVLKIRNELSKKMIFYDLSVHEDTWKEYLKLCYGIKS